MKCWMVEGMRLVQIVIVLKDVRKFMGEERAVA